MPARRVIAVVLWTHMTCFRDLLRGMNAFGNAKRSWQMHFFNPADKYLAFFDRQKPDGLLLGLTDPQQCRLAMSRARHCIGVCGAHWSRGINAITTFETDDERVGEMAAEHLLHKGYRSFAFLGNTEPWSMARGRGFERELRKAGFSCETLLEEFELPDTGRGWHSTDLAGRFVAWLRGLKRPLALMVHHDFRARAIIQICRNEGLRIPDDVAILGVDNDSLDCELSDPPLSSVIIPWRRIGYEAAALLDRLVEGEQIKPTQIAVPPVGVVERASTDSVAVSDADVAAAVRFIRERAHQPTSVEDVLRIVPIGRRSLEKRFRANLKRTPLEEIRRVHLERAKQLLSSTDLSISDVARRSGFGRSTWFSEAFRDGVGVSPAEYRKRYQRA